MQGISNINFGNVTSRELGDHSSHVKECIATIGQFCKKGVGGCLYNMYLAYFLWTVTGMIYHVLMVFQAQCLQIVIDGSLGDNCVFITTYIVNMSALMVVDITSKLWVVPYLITASKDYS
jgi:hypothetical protein